MTVASSDLEALPTAIDRWRAIPRSGRVALVLAALLVGVELALSLVVGSRVGAGRQRCPSSFGTGASGVGAYAQLLGERGHPVTRSRTSVRPLPGPGLDAGGARPHRLDDVGLSRSPGSSGPTPRRGGRPAARRRPAGHPVRSGSLPRWQSRSSGPATRWWPARGRGRRGLVGPHRLADPGRSRRLRPGRPAPHLRGGRRHHGAAAGGGVASSAPLTNAFLAQRDNAALGLNLAGPSGQPVVFDEYDHGYGRVGRGLAGLPSWWRWGLGLALAAVVVWMLSASRRFGPVERATRPLIPARVAYADALASALAALPDAQLVDSVQPLQDEARTLLCRRSGMPGSVDDATLVAAAHGARVPDAGGAGASAAGVGVGRGGTRPGTGLAGRARRQAMTSTHPGVATERIRGALHAEVAKVVVGQGQTVDAVLAAMAVGGHLLLEGPPGVAKTLLASAPPGPAASSPAGPVYPHLLPSDLTGPCLRRPARRAGLRPGPLFTNVLLADEINRTPQDPGRPPRGHARAPGHHRRAGTPPARPVRGPRHREPDRVRGHLPAPRGELTGS